jgi:hypothetical protein
MEKPKRHFDLLHFSTISFLSFLLFASKGRANVTNLANKRYFENFANFLVFFLYYFMYTWERERECVCVCQRDVYVFKLFAHLVKKSFFRSFLGAREYAKKRQNVSQIRSSSEKMTLTQTHTHSTLFISSTHALTLTCIRIKE